MYTATFPGPRPASRRLQYGFQALGQLPITCSTVKLGKGLGMRLMYAYSHKIMQNMAFVIYTLT